MKIRLKWHLSRKHQGVPTDIKLQMSSKSKLGQSQKTAKAFQRVPKEPYSPPKTLLSASRSQNQPFAWFNCNMELTII